MSDVIDIELIRDENLDMDLSDIVETQGGGGGTTNYNLLSNKPQINGVTLQGNKSLDDLGITEAIGTEVSEYVEAHKDELKGDKGDDGFSPVARVEQSSGGAIVTVTDASGTTTATISNGVDGQDGADGQDGFSPVANVTKSGKTATITVTDASGTTTAQVTDGEDGQDYVLTSQDKTDIADLVIGGGATFSATVNGQKLVINDTANGNEVNY